MSDAPLTGGAHASDAHPDEAHPGLAERWASVRAQVADAILEADRDPGEVTTIVVTKFQPVSLLRELVDLGVRDLGESRHQEAQGKAAELAGRGVAWHFVGQLQGKKARQVRRYASVIHSVDRPSLVDALASEDEETRVFLQVNLTDDPARGGVPPAEAEALAEHAAAAAGIRVLGVMAVAPDDGEPRRAFARLRAISDDVRRILPDARAISAGMSGDLREALLEGATHLRIGSAITGKRPDRP
ncbi:YggS family pyridoxal phosphate-dependent enzyme [Clavibacter tessellarius]|uniref:Pyridoxal phosphate homeostasis protein n=1 Tax=Clavibacter tessellarius TaxID=31965 RepID=A0A225CMA9_9MICO|nr:YggS family pyridoxal phosphate-dependent enzyme [Clavibacter michiganensis]OQJ63516.1 YggS family pyridoxal phosphate enzyme [Clavibacter michiganensis subsp. tessellarius]UKF33510.1 YggS family pyridoxal phosphate-dependent enzyme [Clavibacter michiganensis subsp. tessellarius]